MALQIPLHRRIGSAPFLWTLAVLACVGHALLGLTAVAEKGMTSDEIAHITAGYAYWQRHDFRLQPENGNLPQRWAALPLLTLAPTLPPLSHPAWARSDVWEYGRDFFYRTGQPADLMLWLSRAAIAFFSAATGLLVFAWSRALFGWHGGFFSLGCFALCPNFLAHGALATSDVTMVFFFLAAIGALWRWLLAPTAGRLALSVTVVGLSAIAKYSAVLLVPMALVLSIAAVSLGRAREQGWRRRFALGMLAHLAVATFAIWAAFGFRYAAFAPELATEASFAMPWEWMLARLGHLGTAIAWLRQGQLLPEAYLYGFTFVLDFAQQRGAFLNGNYGIHGWFMFFPYAFLVKTPLTLLGLWAIGVFTVARHSWLKRMLWREACVRYAPLAALFVVYWYFSLTSRLNIGHRHILPIYPPLFIALGALGAWAALVQWRQLILAAAVLLLGWESSQIRPHYLAYFNTLAGGPAEGYRHLVDSSLDWGQDLPALAQWLRQNRQPGEPTYLAYFGTGDPVYEGITAQRLPSLPVYRDATPRLWPGAGLYAISATMLQHAYSPIRGPWTMDAEREFQNLRAQDADFHAHALTSATSLSPAQWEQAWRRYELLRFARLCHYLRVRQPDAMAGYSILIYRLTQEEVRATTAAPLADWVALIERAANQRE
ncbi:MAG: glycosyltransferase family 39 protein [Opitutae bacterium]|nr:glycosyltransferase family 39 protein [Opitutae bacterium]